MPDLSDLVPFHSGQVEKLNFLVLGQVPNLYKGKKSYIFHILVNYYEFTCCIETVWIYTVYKRVDICMISYCF